MRLPKFQLRSRVVLTLLGGAGIALGLGVTQASAGVCQDLWVQRNSIYKAYGYCFKSTKAIDYFGNAGCIYHNEGSIPMSYADKSAVLAIKQREKNLGCL